MDSFFFFEINHEFFSQVVAQNLVLTMSMVKANVLQVKHEHGLLIPNESNIITLEKSSWLADNYSVKNGCQSHLVIVLYTSDFWRK